MKNTVPSGQFRKDVKRMVKRVADYEKLSAAITLLKKDIPLPAQARPHKLSGKWYGFWECHIRHDWLLIYRVTKKEVILARTGTHADLFE